MAYKTGPGIWIDDDEAQARSEGGTYGTIAHIGLDYPPHTEPRLYPAVNPNRVTGSKYRAYSSKYGEWAQAANRVLANHARSNFERGKR